MKKILILIFLSFLSTNLIACKNNTSLNNELITFEKEISSYTTYNPLYLKDYYTIYQQTNSYITSLNTINYPNFLNPLEIKKSITIKDTPLVNRYFYLSKDYLPKKLVKVQNVNYVRRENEEMLLDENTLIMYQKMEIFLKQKNINILLFSSFRTYEKQASLWNNNIQTNNLFLAKPGHSEHQTGLAVDIGTKDSGLTIHFENTKEFQVLKENAHLFGFILRYPKEKENITGYAYEPWHFRYVGTETAKIIYENNLTLEEYFYYYLLLNY